MARDPIPGAFTLQAILERNQDFIIPAAWRELGAPEALRRVRAMRVRNLLQRQALLDACQDDPDAQSLEMSRCAEDFIYFVTRYLWMFNSDLRQTIPFLPVEAQVRELLYPLYFDQYTPLDPDNPSMDRRHHIVEKPRYVGASYCVLAAMVWICCFHRYWPGEEAGTPAMVAMCADREEHVYSVEDPECHMGRLEQMFRRLPKWMLPNPIYPLDDEEKDKGTERLSRASTFSGKKISWPGTKSMIVGKAANGSFGRSKRARLALVDEEAHMTEGPATVRSADGLSACVWRLSSVKGQANSHYRDMNNPNLKITRHRLSVLDVPWYDEEWLSEKRRTMSPEDFAQEIMCDTKAQVGRAYWAPPFDMKVNVVDTPIPVVPGSTLWIGLDIGKADGLSMLYLQRDEVRQLVNCHGMVFRKDALVEWMVPFILGEFPKRNLVGDEFPSEDLWHPLDREFVRTVGKMRATATRIRVVSGSDAAEERMTSDSFVTQLWRMWRITVIPVKLTDKLEAIDKVKWMVPYFRVNSKVNALTPGQYDTTHEPPFHLSDVFFQYRKKVNRQTDEVLPAGRPVHDRFSNPADALQYLVHEMPRVMRRSPAEIQRLTTARQAAESDRLRKGAVKVVFRSAFGRGVNA